MKVEKSKDAQVRSGAGKKILITKEHSIGDIMKYHKEGWSIHFDGSADNFVDLSAEDFGQMPKSLMTYYVIALKERAGKLHDVTKTISEVGTARAEFGYDLRVADPVDQLKIENIPKGMTAKWVRAYEDNIRKNERKGYVQARGNDVKTFGNDGSKPGGHYIGSESRPEMTVMLISEENFQKNSNRIKRKADKVKEVAKQTFRDSIEKTGLKGAMSEVEGN